VEWSLFFVLLFDPAHLDVLPYMICIFSPSVLFFVPTFSMSLIFWRFRAPVSIVANVLCWSVFRNVLVLRSITTVEGSRDAVLVFLFLFSSVPRLLCHDF